MILVATGVFDFFRSPSSIRPADVHSFIASLQLLTGACAFWRWRLACSGIFDSTVSDDVIRMMSRMDGFSKPYGCSSNNHNWINQPGKGQRKLPILITHMIRDCKCYVFQGQGGARRGGGGGVRGVQKITTFTVTLVQIGTNSSWSQIFLPFWLRCLSIARLHHVINIIKSSLQVACVHFKPR